MYGVIRPSECDYKNVFKSQRNGLLQLAFSHPVGTVRVVHRKGSCPLFGGFLSKNYSPLPGADGHGGADTDAVLRRQSEQPVRRLLSVPALCVHHRDEGPVEVQQHVHDSRHLEDETTGYLS